MKKFLFLLMSLAVTTGAIAGVPQAKSDLTQTKRYGMKVNAPAPVMQMAQERQQAMNFTLAKDVKGDHQTLKAVVTQEPSGTKYYYSRSGNALFLGAGGEGLYYGAQSGTVEVVVDNNTYWFKNLLYDPYGCYSDYWVKGTKNGSNITLSLPQDISTHSVAYDDDLSIKLRWGASTVSSGQVSGTVNTNISSRTFVMDADGNLSLQYASMTSAAVGNGLMACFSYSGTWYFDYMMIYDTELTYLGTSIPEAPTMYTEEDILTLAETSGELYKYNRYGDAIVRVSTETGVTLDLAEQKGTNYLYFDADGSTVYMMNPVYGWSNYNFIKGTVNGDQLVFPLGQYIYWDDNFLGLKTAWGTYVDGEGYTNDETATEVSFTVADGVITMNNAGVLSYDEETGDFSVVGLSLLIDSAYLEPGWFGCLDFYTQYYDIPTVPTNFAVEPASTTADASWTDTDDAAWNLRYREAIPGTENNMFWGFEEDNNDNETVELTGGWTSIDADGDGKGWYHLTGSTFNNHDGIGHVTSASYDNSGALTPDNWLVSPAISLNGTLSFWAAAQDPNYAAENFAVYVNAGGDPTNTADFTMISEKMTATGEMTQHTFDLSSYAGQTGYVAIRHYDTEDMFRLNIDDIELMAVQPAEWIYVEDNPLDVTNYTIEGLEPETTYEAQVQACNKGGVSTWTDIVTFTTLEAVGMRGDVDMDNNVKISDVTALIGALLSGSWDGLSYDNADTDLNGVVNITDVTTLINYLLSGNWPD